MIKCPNIRTHLLTFKKIQYDLHQENSFFDEVLKLEKAEKDKFMATRIEQHIVSSRNATETDLLNRVVGMFQKYTAFWRGFCTSHRIYPNLLKKEKCQNMINHSFRAFGP